MIKFWNILLFSMNVVMLLGVSYFVATRGYVAGGGWTAPELITVVLAALALLITVLGIFIAVLAIWGYGRLSEDAKSTADAVAREVAKTIAESVATATAVAEIERKYGQPDGDFGVAAGGDNGPSN